jgi:uncharacterized protein (TIGR02996 family)
MTQPTSPFDHPEARALLRAVLADPEDAPRLVLADWLEEHGHAQRAEFIRVQLALARLAARDPEYQPLAARSRELENGPAQGWRKQEQPPSCLLDTVYHRGFLGEVQGTVAKWVKSAGGLFRMAPIRVATIELFGTKVKEFAQSPALARLARLTLLTIIVNDQEANWLADSPFLAAVPHIVLENIQQTPTHLSAQAQQRLRTSLGTRLHLRAVEWRPRPITSANES